jgi:hypothetical protein
MRVLEPVLVGQGVNNNANFRLSRALEKPKNARTGWLWAPCGVGLCDNKAIRLDFWAPFLSSFLLALKERIK